MERRFLSPARLTVGHVRDEVGVNLYEVLRQNLLGRFHCGIELLSVQRREHIFPRLAIAAVRTVVSSLSVSHPQFFEVERRIALFRAIQQGRIFLGRRILRFLWLVLSRGHAKRCD